MQGDGSTLHNVQQPVHIMKEAVQVLQGSPSASCTSNFQPGVCVLNNEAEEVKICKGMVLPCTSCNRQCTSCKKQCKSCKEAQCKLYKEAPVQVVQEIFEGVFVC